MPDALRAALTPPPELTPVPAPEHARAALRATLGAAPAAGGISRWLSFRRGTAKPSKPPSPDGMTAMRSATPRPPWRNRYTPPASANTGRPLHHRPVATR